MKNDFKNELLVLVNSFLFENDTQKGIVIEKIRLLIDENVKNEPELVIINNLLNRNYKTQISNFCVSEGQDSKQMMLSIFSLIFSILSFQE
ncbi:hypothetical protein [Flavobacterium sp. I3-2]|uniref:hypothetical protein n=1 Tax=Flavobacterium sp. I3-2 TaxID=2748319 RepID=UPI0015B025B5|nr:hypothetical protein [Flavobacterium sp. I3-2]